MARKHTTTAAAGAAVQTAQTAHPQVLMDAARQLERAARQVRKIAQQSPATVTTYRSQLIALHANINAALARLPESPGIKAGK
jgi:hypothetical protein